MDTFFTYWFLAGLVYVPILAVVLGNAQGGTNAEQIYIAKNLVGGLLVLHVLMVLGSCAAVSTIF